MPRVATLQAEIGSLLWLATGLGWLAASLWKGRSTSTAPGLRWRVLLFVAFTGYGFLFAERPDRLHPLWLAPPPVGWMLVAALAAALGFAWWARMHLGRLWSGTMVLREGHRVVESGPYGIVRHPIYTGLIGGAVALALLKATPLALVGATLIAIGFGAKARLEERFLGEALGRGAYADYARRVPRLVPFGPR